ncbi:MAG: trimethylamine methyltransferase family protein [Rhodospirillales bacterium]|jgi:trimethylamine---corrinoid protein Co-methyltransferase|nr:trimethylamine methyltransferase family protein [Rhodospirillales bacterium]
MVQQDSSEFGVRRGGRRRTQKPDDTHSIAAPAYLTRTIMPYDYLSEEGVVRIEAEADRLLCEIGMEFRGHEPSLKYLREAGAKVRGELVKFEPGMCREIIQKFAPKSFTQISRNSERNVLISPDTVVFSPLYGAPFVRSMDIERRYSTLEDFNNFVKLAHMSPSMHHAGGTICEVNDIPVSKRHLDMVYSHLRFSDKPFMGAVTSGWQAKDSIDMMEIAYGEKVVDENCCILGLINPTSPMVFDRAPLEALHVYSERGQGCIIDPFVIAGVSGPVTPAAILAQLFAESMAGIALAQLIRPGTPVILAINSMGINMRTGTPIRFDETWKCVLAIGQLARRLGVPFRCGGASTSSKLPDAQAGIESTLYLYNGLLSGSNFFVHGAGALELGLCISYEKFLLDCELLSSISKMVTEIDCSDDAFAFDEYLEVGPGGNFLATKHTLARYKDAFFQSNIFDSNSFENWRDAGAPDAEKRANTAIKKMLEEFEEPPIEGQVIEALEDFISRRKSELPDSYA